MDKNIILVSGDDTDFLNEVLLTINFDVDFDIEGYKACLTIENSKNIVKTYDLNGPILHINLDKTITSTLTTGVHKCNVKLIDTLGRVRTVKVFDITVKDEFSNVYIDNINIKPDKRISLVSGDDTDFLNEILLTINFDVDFDIEGYKACLTIENSKNIVRTYDLNGTTLDITLDRTITSTLTTGVHKCNVKLIDTLGRVRTVKVFDITVEDEFSNIHIDNINIKPDKRIFLVRGDDTDFLNEILLTINFDVDFDIEGYKARLTIENSHKIVRTYDLNGTTLDITLDKAITSTLTTGVHKCNIKLIDILGRVRTVKVFDIIVENEFNFSNTYSNHFNMDISVTNLIDYNTRITNKPSINSVLLEGNKSLEELGIQPQGDYALKIELQEGLDTKADKATTLKGYNINDAYTKEEIDAKLTSLYRFKGTVANYESLPTANLVVGDVYNVEETGANYAWDGTTWDKLGENIDLSPYATKEEMQEGLDEKQPKGDYLTEHQDISYLATKTEVEEELKNKQDKGDYALKSELPDITPLATKEEVDKKIDKQQGVDNAGKMLVVGEDGNITLETSIGEIEATDVVYTNEQYPEMKNIQDAMDKLLYTTPTVSISGGGSYEIGYTKESTTLSWTWNKKITSQSLNQGIGTLDSSVRSYTYNKSISSNTTFTITGSDGTTTKSASTTLSFIPKRYWGVSTETSLTDAQILALSNELSTTRVQTRIFDCSGGKYFYFIIRADYCNGIKFKVGGLAFSDMIPTTRNVVNAQGYSQSYNIYRVNNLQNGSEITVEIL